MTFALVIAFGMNFFAYWFSDKIVLRLYGARQVKEAELPETYGIVARLLQKAYLPMPKVYVMDQEQPNAFATGRNPATWRRSCDNGDHDEFSRERNSKA